VPEPEPYNITAPSKCKMQFFAIPTHFASLPLAKQFFNIEIADNLFKNKTNEASKKSLPSFAATKKDNRHCVGLKYNKGPFTCYVFRGEEMNLLGSCNPYAAEVTSIK
jgi:hypothetical protein